ncbi:MAG: 50S ribosomal protein L6 [Patescibacteria group bacterium]|nr:50S ribosomal protein L6 [Patescibacteria group bacterium]
MSRIGNKSIELRKDVVIDIQDNQIRIKGPQGELSYHLPESLRVEKKENYLVVRRLTDDKEAKSLHGLYRQLFANAVIGVCKKWEKQLKLVGTGYNARVENGDLVLKIGYSHPVIFKRVEGIDFQAKENTVIIVSGCDKQKVGEVAYQIRKIKKPDPYKGKGILYVGEKLRIKPGKKAKAGSAT